MAKCVVVCAAEVSMQDWAEADVKPCDLVIAADAGYLRLEALGIMPHIIVGDFDSAPVPSQQENSKVEIHPVKKNDTDCLIAVNRGWQMGIREFIILGALGGKRLDHTIANLQTLDYITRIGGSARIISGGTYAQVVHNGSISIDRTEGKLSVFAMSESCWGVTLRGVKYPLEDYTLTCGFPLGVSNDFDADKAEISVQMGSLLVIWTRDEV